MNQRIGIYSGTFDPLHKGHVSFALAAIAQANLNMVYFLPERSPRHKPYVSPYIKREAYIQEQISTFDSLDLIQLPDDKFSVLHTLPELQASFPGSQLVLLVGSDVVEHMPQWPDIKHLVTTCELLVGIRSGGDEANIRSLLRAIGAPDALVVTTPHAHLSSTDIRRAV